MKVLITGGTGFIGSHVTRELLHAGHTVISLSRRALPAGSIHANLLPALASFGDSQALEALLPGTDVVLHLGWSSVPGDRLDRLSFEADNDIVGSLNLFAACAKHGVRKLVFISSGGTVYGFPRHTPIPETHATEPVSAYGIAKLAVEKYLSLFHRLHGLDYVILRISNAYGENQTITKGQGVIGFWMDRIRKGQHVEIWGNGDAVRDYIYISDVVSVVTSAVTGDQLDSGVYNLGSGKGHSLNDILDILRVLSPPFEVRYKPVRKVDVDVNVLDTSRLRQKLHFQAMHSLESGIRKTWEYAAANK